LHQPWLQLLATVSAPDILDDRSAQACGNARTMAHKTTTVL